MYIPWVKSNNTITLTLYHVIHSFGTILFGLSVSLKNTLFKDFAGKANMSRSHGLWPQLSPGKKTL